MSSESSSALDSEQRCVTCGIHGFWTPRMWECDECRDYFLCENCHKGSQHVSEALPASPQVHSRRRRKKKKSRVHDRDHHMSPHEIGSFCDGCGSDPIYNQRWHCTVCPDFDLCEACYGQLGALDLPSEHLKEHPMIAVEVICSEMLLKCQPSFTKPLDPQWSYKVKNNDMATSGFVWAKRKPKAGMLNGMDDAGGNAIEDNSVPISKLKDQINPNFGNLFSKQASQSIQMYGMLDKKHKVFLSHARTEKDFVTQLYQDLSKVHHFGIFFDKEDDNLSEEKPFPKRIFDVAKHCELAIVVISHEYLSCKLSMLELVAFVEAQKTRPELKILPVFYKLSVEEFKKGQKAFKKTWNMLGLVSKDEMDKWEEALEVISRTNGLEYEKKLGGLMFRDRIVEAMYKHVNRKLMWDDSHVQGKTKMQERVQKMIQISKNPNSGQVPMIRTLRMGLFGVGGCGKTTMCKVLQNQMMPHYLGKVHHIEFGSKDLLHMRSMLLQSICHLESSLTQTVDARQALTLLKTHIPKQRVCLFIDNVSNDPLCIEEARTLLNLPFKEGSLIVVTSRNSIILETLKIEKRLTMRVPSLTTNDAKALFSYHAGCDTSSLTKQQIKEMESFVKLCNFRVQDFDSQEYHPLALKVMGSRLGSNPEKWQNIRIDFKYNENENMHPIFSILRSNFETLNLKYQRIFLDIALATNDCNVNLAMGDLMQQLRYLYDEADEQFNSQVVEVLQASSLIEFYDVDNETIYIHDLYREFARLEVEEKGLQHSVRCCFSRGRKHHHVVQEGRVRIHDDPVSHIMKDILSCTICLEAKLLSIQDCANLVSVDVPGMENLRMFHVIGDCPQLISVNLDGAVNLRSMVWLGFEGKFYPNLTSMESLEQLKLENDEVESPGTLHGCLDFSKNSNLELLFLSYLPLKMLNLSQAVSLKELNLKNCQHLESLEGLEALALLEIVALRACSSLVEFPSLANFPSLKEFLLEGAAKLKQLQGFPNLANLRCLSLKGGRQLEDLPGIEACLKLSKLWLSGTSIRDCSWISTMKDLTIIYLCGTKIRFVPDCSHLCKLSELWLDDCQALESIGLKTRSFPPTFPQSLQTFSAKKCESLNALPEFQKESALSHLNVSGTSIQDVSSVSHCKQLQRLRLAKTQITSLPDVSNFSRLELLDVHGCELLTRMDHIKSLLALERLWVYGCTSLLALPNLQNSTGLMKLDLSGCVLVDPNVVKLPSASSVHVVMDGVPYYSQLDQHIDAQECEDKTSALEPTHNLWRRTTLLYLVAMGGLLVWRLGRRQRKHKLITQH